MSGVCYVMSGVSFTPRVLEPARIIFKFKFALCANWLQKHIEAAHGRGGQGGLGQAMLRPLMAAEAKGHNNNSMKHSSAWMNEVHGVV